MVLGTDNLAKIKEQVAGVCACSEFLAHACTCVCVVCEREGWGVRACC